MKARTNTASRAKRRVLLVDDDRVLRHVVTSLLKAEGLSVSTAAGGGGALELLAKKRFDLLLLDVGLPDVSGLEVLKRVPTLKSPPRVIMMTADDTPETILRAFRDQAYAYLTKPFPPREIAEAVRQALAAPIIASSIEVISARPEWLELLVPCSLDAAERIQGFLMRLEAHLPDEVRESVGLAFHELLSNAIEWGGRLDPNRRVRIACVRTKRMLLYRIADPGAGFRPEALGHAAVSHPDDPFKHGRIREDKGLRAGGFGLALAQAMVDELVYNEAHNEVLFVKYLEPPSPNVKVCDQEH